MVNDATSTETIRGLSRQVARRQLTSVEHYEKTVQRYADNLRQYAHGQIGATEFGKDVLNLGLDQVTWSAEDVMKLGAEYYRWVWSLLGVKVRDGKEEKHEADSGGQQQAQAEQVESESLTP